MFHAWVRVVVRLAVATALPAAIVRGQGASTSTTTLVGMVRDSAGVPVPSVEVALPNTGLITRTSEAGGFRFVAAPVGSQTLTLRRLGYEQSVVDVLVHAGQIDSIVIVLNPAALTIEGMRVAADERSKRLLAGFWERRERGLGHFVTRDEIEKRDARDFADLVRMVPGVSVVHVGGRQQVRFGRSPSIRGDCPPLYWVDGMRVENATSDEFLPRDIEAVEVYNGVATMPAQFAPRTANIRQTCGVIVIWTRLPGT